MHDIASRVNALLVAIITTLIIATIVQVVTFFSDPPLMDGQSLPFGAAFAYLLLLAFVILLPHLASLSVFQPKLQLTTSSIVILTITYLIAAAILAEYLLPTLPAMLPALCPKSHARCPSAEIMFAILLIALSFLVFYVHRIWSSSKRIHFLRRSRWWSTSQYNS